MIIAIPKNTNQFELALNKAGSIKPYITNKVTISDINSKNSTFFIFSLFVV